MVSGNIIIFGDPAIDTGFIVKLAGASYLYPFRYRLRSVFKRDFYPVTISDQQYRLHHTAGIPSSRTGRSSLQAPDVLENLYYLIHQFDSIELLIYVVRTDKPTSNNFRFFYDYVCQQDVPIILVQTTHTPSELSWFDLVLTLDGADPEIDKVNLHKAITKHLNRSPKFIPQIERFESAAKGCWKLLVKEAGWSLADFRDAFRLTYEKNRRFTENEVNARCERIIQHVRMSLKKPSAKNEIQQRVDAIMSTIIPVDNVTSVPFLSVATESIVNISETVQVCATTIDLRS
jgi:hypothetical protein